MQASIGIAAAGADLVLDTVLRHADVASITPQSSAARQGYVRYVPGIGGNRSWPTSNSAASCAGLDSGEFRVVLPAVMGLDEGGDRRSRRWSAGCTRPGHGLRRVHPGRRAYRPIVPLGRWVLRETAGRRAWLAEFGPTLLQKAGPNVSARQLHDPDFVSDVVAALADSGLSSDRLVLELTESEVLRGRQVSRTLHELDGMGVKLALDDFGTGESSLSLLRSFPAAIVKLDSLSWTATRSTRATGARDARRRWPSVIQRPCAALDTVADASERRQPPCCRELATSCTGRPLARPPARVGHDERWPHTPVVSAN